VKRLLGVLLLCVTVYFNDGTFQCFKDATVWVTDSDIFRKAAVLNIRTNNQILDSVASIPIDKVKIVTHECK
jgi:hypothetical protein